MTKTSELEAQKKRQNIQMHYWNLVGAVEHINLPKLEDKVKKELKCSDDRFIQTEARIRVQSKEKVWIKQPSP